MRLRICNACVGDAMADRLFGVIGGFFRDERGAVSIDWVILTAGVVVLAIGVSSVFNVNLEDVVATTICDDDGATTVVAGGSALTQVLVNIRVKTGLFGGEIFHGNPCG